ncbi:MAG: Na/Pi cotransporter family protein [Stomatobaculum sp.]|nr:Na/Pi cotransporter family protein [Stomatobaculum sp.]
MLDKIASLFMFAGGLGMFLYGMHIMAEGMQKAAGNKMKDFLGMLTGNRFLAVGIGALITAIIQSSGATTVMVVGFVSAGLMTLSQAVGVIMGANIGTTITAWIVSLSQLGDSVKALNPQFYAPMLIGIGSGIIMFSKSKKKLNAAEIIIGIGFLFEGLKFMSDAIKPYTGAPIFSTIFTTLGANPLLGVLAGALITALLQSSSVSVGILQTLAVNGLVTTNAAVFITLGENIGSCVTALLSAIGGSRTAKRAAVIHLSFNVIGAILFGVLGFILFTARPEIAFHKISPVEISLFHTGFKLSMTVILFPFAEKLVQLSGILVPKTQADIDAEQAAEAAMIRLDPRIFNQPGIAVEALSKEVVRFGTVALDNIQRACEVCFTRDPNEMQKVFSVEKQLNEMHTQLTKYLIQANTLPLNDRQKLIITNLFNSLTDIERSGDHAENITEQVQILVDRNLELSETGVKDLRDITAPVMQGFAAAIQARKRNDIGAALRVGETEERVDRLRDEMKETHIERLSAGQCDPAAGIVFIEIVDNLERISDHAQNMAEYILSEN